MGGKNPVQLVASGLAIPPYDYEIHTYTGDNPTQTVYKRGGASGTTVATVTRTFNGAKLLTQTLVLS
jgi:hypothetical protein